MQFCVASDNINSKMRLEILDVLIMEEAPLEIFEMILSL